jgi:hypothetical protein
MKYVLSTILILTFPFLQHTVHAQSINWRSFNKDTKRLFNLNAGFDYGVTIALGYGQRIKTSLPVVLNAELSIPAGGKVLDDFKTKLGGQTELLRLNRFSATIKAYGVFRRYESEYVRLLNFGSEISAVIGLYTPTWYVSGEAGFDKAIVTHVKHLSAMREAYPDIKDGWYVPTGGNFFYGLQVGRSFRKQDIYLRAGKTMAQDFRNTSSIPLYFQVGFNSRF